MNGRAAAPSGAASACCAKTKLRVSLVHLDFLDDHGELDDAWLGPDSKPEWRDIGVPYSHPDWQRGIQPNPVSYSMVKSQDPDRRDPVGGKKAKKSNRMRLKVKLHLQIEPSCACPDKCKIRGLVRARDGKKVALFSSGWITLKPSSTVRKLTMTAKHVIRRKIMRSMVTIDWTIRSHPRSAHRSYPKTNRFGRTTNERLVTFGEPKLTSTRESGVTLRRMRRSVRWVGEKGTTDHPRIISYLFGKFDAYTLVELKAKAGGGYVITYSNLTRGEKRKLRGNKALLKRLGDLDWSSYFGDAGAWPACDPELVQWGAECQAICRLVIGMLHQLGSKADLELVYVWADFAKPNEAVAKTPADLYAEGIDAEPTGPDASKNYVLVDSIVNKGEKYISPVRDPKDKKWKIPAGYVNMNSVGWNSFEAYVRYQYTASSGKKSTRWYGGGVGEHRGNPVHVFEGIAEYDAYNAIIYGQIVGIWEITGVYEYKKQRYQ